MYACLVCRGTFETDIQFTESFFSTPIFEPLLKQTLPSGFLVELINFVVHQFGDLNEIFEPLLRNLVREVHSSTVVELGNYQKVVNVLTELCEITVTEKNRPICQLMTEMTEWLPAEIAAGAGNITEMRPSINRPVVPYSEV